MKDTHRFNRNFVLLWQGQLVSQIGSQVFALAGLLWLKQATESTLLVALLSATFVVPNLLAAPIGGVLADRYSRRRVLIACDLARGSAVLMLAVIWSLFPAAHPVSLASQFILTFVIGATAAVFQPTGVALVPDLVPREGLQRANAAMQSSLQFGGLVAQTLSGVLLRLVGAPLLALIDAASYLYSAVSTLLIRPPAATATLAAPRVRPSLTADLREGLAYVRTVTGLWAVIVASAGLKFFVAPFVVLFAFYVEGPLHASADWYGFLVGAMGVGAMAGFALPGVLKTGPGRDAVAILAALAALAALLGLLALATRPATALLLVTLAGVANGYVNVKLLTRLQLAIAPAMRGRVFGVFTTITQALVPVGTIVGAAVAGTDGRNVAWVYAGCGVALMAVTLAMAVSRTCRAFLRGETAATPPPAGGPTLAAPAAAGR